MDVARAALREAGEDWDVVSAGSGPLEQVMPDWRVHEWGRELGADLLVWRVVMVSDELSGEALIEVIDRSTYGSVIGIAN